MEAYIQNLFGSLQADGIVVNPYMGDDVMLPLVELADKSIVVLVKTSNPSGGIVQDVILQDGQPLWHHVLDLVVNRWNRNGNMIPVLSSTVELNADKLRVSIPDKMPILLAGVGAQGGSYTGLRKLLNSEGIGVFVNSSRGILYPQSRKPWLIAIEKAAIELKESLNKEGRAQ
jgi:orotidine-5'-phosphate decarboxylase